MNNTTFEDLMAKARRQLEHGLEYGRVTFADVLDSGSLSKGLNKKMEEIEEKYLDEVPESFENAEEMECYIQELSQVIEECKENVRIVREWGRRYRMTPYTKAVLNDADDTIQDLVFEYSACERALDIIENMEEKEPEPEEDGLDLFIKMFFENDPHGVEKLRDAADRLESIWNRTTPKTDTRTEQYIRYESTGPHCAPCNPECCATKACDSCITCINNKITSYKNCTSDCTSEG